MHAGKGNRILAVFVNLDPGKRAASHRRGRSVLAGVAGAVGIGDGEYFCFFFLGVVGFMHIINSRHWVHLRLLFTAWDRMWVFIGYIGSRILFWVLSFDEVLLVTSSVSLFSFA